MNKLEEYFCLESNLHRGRVVKAFSHNDAALKFVKDRSNYIKSGHLNILVTKLDCMTTVPINSQVVTELA